MVLDLEWCLFLVLASAWSCCNVSYRISEQLSLLSQRINCPCCHPPTPEIHRNIFLMRTIKFSDRQFNKVSFFQRDWYFLSYNFSPVLNIIHSYNIRIAAFIHVDILMLDLQLIRVFLLYSRYVTSMCEQITCCAYYQPINHFNLIKRMYKECGSLGTVVGAILYRLFLRIAQLIHWIWRQYGAFIIASNAFFLFQLAYFFSKPKRLKFPGVKDRGQIFALFPPLKLLPAILRNRRHKIGPDNRAEKIGVLFTFTIYFSRRHYPGWRRWRCTFVL